MKHWPRHAINGGRGRLAHLSCGYQTMLSVRVVRAARSSWAGARGPSVLLELLFETFKLFLQLLEFRLESFHFAFQF